jgi:hypothetical protein
MSFRHVVTAVGRFALIVLLSLPSAHATESANTCPDSAQQYWKTFRVVALKGNPRLVADLSRFPFKLRGTLDDSVARELTREDFVRLFPTFLKTDPGLTPTATTMRAFVKATTKLSPAFCNASGNQIRVGAWVFELGSEGWRFVQAFVED